MRSDLPLGGLAAVLCLLVSAHSAHGAESRYIAQGYWAWTENSTAFYARYLRITGDSGYYCFLDGKSGFAFAIAKDSITTPMNGRNALQWMPNSGDLVITGSEKGVSYSDRFQPIDSTAYWGQCRDQDKAAGPTGLGGSRGRSLSKGRVDARGLFRWRREGYSLSGRKTPPEPSAAVH